MVDPANTGQTAWCRKHYNNPGYQSLTTASQSSISGAEKMSEAGSPTVEQMQADSNAGSGEEDDEYEQAGESRESREESEGSEKQEIAEQSDDEGKKAAAGPYRIKKKGAAIAGEGSSSKKQKTEASKEDTKKKEDEEDDDDDDDEEEEEEEEGLKESKYVVQHGAHREYRVREKFILHEAKRAMTVRNGLHIGSMLGSRSGKLWDGLKWFHVTILGGTLTTTGKFESCPYVCFKPVGEDVVSDDEVWLRPIPAKVMEHWIPLWTEEIKEKYKQDQERAKRLIGESAPGGYKTVLKWEDSMISGPKLEVQQLGIGKRGMVILKEKLKSIRENPPTQPKGGAKVAAAAPAAAISKGGQTKLAAGLMMRGKGMASSSADNESEQSDLTTVPQARTIKIGASATTKTFEADGVLYATFLA
jgi:hypothetical protein